MTYQIIQPPFTLKFQEMPKQELKDYFAWFQGVVPERLNILTRNVQQTPGFEAWQPDLTPASLDLLGSWFAAQAETRSRTEGEIQEIEDRLLFPIEVSDKELTNRTFSLAIDIGMYLSQVFLENHRTLQWDQLFSKKKDVDYGQPVLVGFGQVPFNPVRMMVTLAYGLVDKSKTGKRLRDLYDIWANMVGVRVDKEK